MFGPGMFSPAVMNFFKQAGEEFQKCAQADAAGKLDKALDKYCEGRRPLGPEDPMFLERCTLYAAKAYAVAHLDGKITWGQIKALLDQSPAWPPKPGLNSAGCLFLAYMLGFLYGSDLPQDTHQSIEGMLPMASQIAASPDAFAQKLGMDPSKLREMASNMGNKGMEGLGGMMDMLKPRS